MHTIILYNIRALNIILLFESVYGIRSYKLCILYIQYIICIQIVCILRARTRGVYESYSTSKYVVYIHTMHMHHTSRVCIHASRPSLAQMHPPGLYPGVIESWLRGWDPGGRLNITSHVVVSEKPGGMVDSWLRRRDPGGRLNNKNMLL